MSTIKGNSREESLKWWDNLTFEEKWIAVIKAKDHVTGYPDRNPNTLTGREIQLIHLKNKTL